MATSVTNRHLSVSSSTPTSRNNERISQLNPNDYSSQKKTSKESSPSLITEGVPVKFADNLFSVLVKDQLNHLLNLPKIKGLKYTEENAARIVTFEITEVLKRIVAEHIKDNYKAIIQVMTYPKQDENHIIIMNQCLWNYRTDDVLSVETETDAFKFFIAIHGVVS